MCFMLGGASIGWRSRKEPLVALSSCEVQYIIVSLCACQKRWMVNLVEEIIGQNRRAITMKIDNMSAINREKNLIEHGNNKHIEMRFHNLQEKVAKGNLNLEHYRAENHISHITTKVVQVELFMRLITVMNVDSLDTKNYVVCLMCNLCAKAVFDKVYINCIRQRVKHFKQLSKYVVAERVYFDRVELSNSFVYQLSQLELVGEQAN